MPRTRLLVACLATMILLVASCGNGDRDETTDEEPAESAPSSSEAEPTGGAETAAFPVTIESTGGTWTLDAAPERIVSLSPTSTEVLFAIGAGDQVVAADQFSTYPPEAPTTDLSGFDPNIEAIVAFEPDLVVLANDANDLVAGLGELDIPVLVSPPPADIESGYPQMAELGAITGHVDGATEAIAIMRAQIEEALANAPEVPVRVYHELDDTFFAASSFGFVGSVYAEMGAQNIADAADGDRSGFPQLTEESIVAADPELIVIPDDVAYTAADVAARPGWESITAVAQGNIVVVDADTASRWGPRLPVFVEAAAEALAAVTAPVG